MVYKLYGFNGKKVKYDWKIRKLIEKMSNIDKNKKEEKTRKKGMAYSGDSDIIGESIDENIQDDNDDNNEDE